MEKSTKTLEFKKLYYEVRNTDNNIKSQYARIIESLSGNFESGKLTGILGSSGCGKTHFLNMLVGNIESDAKTHGQILYNGLEIEPDSWKKKIAYLPQDDFYYPNISVYDHLMFYASLGNTNYIKDIDSYINNVLEMCSILHKKHFIISKLSGGERKRAMIAIAIISKPEVLILDEPTTGLDSNTALEIISTLKNYAKTTNSIVICTVHQPGSGLFNLFDYIMVMVKLGVFYAGPVNELDTFFYINGLTKSEELSIPEFIFVIISDSSNPVSIRYRNKILEIVERNKLEDRFEFTPTKCNNTKQVSWSYNYSDVKLMSKFYPKVYFGVPWTINYIFKSFITLLAFIIGPLVAIGHILYLDLDFENVSQDLKMCTYTEIFIFSCSTTYSTYLASIADWWMFSYFGIFQDKKMFKAEYSIGRYSFGSYFLYTFLATFTRIIMIFFAQLPIYIIIFRAFMLNPLFIVFSSLFLIILAFVMTFTTLLINFHWVFIILMSQAWRFFIITSSRNYNGDFIVVKRNFIGYFLKLVPMYNFVTFFNSLCSGFVSKMYTKSLYSLARTMDKSDSFRSFGYNWFLMSKKHYLLDSKWIIITCFLGSCVFFLILMYLLCRIFLIPNMRTKLTKTY